jgi:methylenetetrahydrofolate dehydrogenase (NADP+)/methenyltetrahydrofolate cyclohydrolase
MWDYVSATSNPNVLIIGRSRLVGKPLAMMLEVMWDCTVTLAHSKTSQESINNLSATADVVVVATGTPKGIRLPHVNPNALIIDVGVNKDETGTLCGDVDHSSLPKEVSITASPGGVGLLTVECLCTNLISAWRNQWLKEHPSF